MTYANAGHPYPLIYRDGEIRMLKKGGLVLGPNPDAVYERGYLAFRPATAMLLYSDGIVEAANEAGEEFGVERLVEILRRYNKRPAAETVDRVFENVERFSHGPMSDDRTVVVVRRPGRTKKK